jgi:hypothetical protein
VRRLLLSAALITLYSWSASAPAATTVVNPTEDYPSYSPDLTAPAVLAFFNPLGFWYR